MISSDRLMPYFIDKVVLCNKNDEEILWTNRYIEDFKIVKKDKNVVVNKEDKSGFLNKKIFKHIYIIKKYQYINKEKYTGRGWYKFKIKTIFSEIYDVYNVYVGDLNSGSHFGKFTLEDEVVKCFKVEIDTFIDSNDNLSIFSIGNIKNQGCSYNIDKGVDTAIDIEQGAITSKRFLDLDD